ncbi:tryptophan 2,3-dioxygenase [Paraburkholderia silviterrae]|uniref:Tryptophan 2,3-dioxygenase n=1 Tax=Paraburkholderia silviterrae TaxID=2528715 RepID=A0A4R5M1G7_9BURK|nr:tryptophan 2,3-dioxygenase family protein [Paraburkholderia silviterrae]TDG18993.1 tryptophan 2,3-dioxygenase [Paraburkholderia silviterrae]
METWTSAPHAHPETQAWLDDYLSRGHEKLGRAGHVCPFVRPAMNAGTLLMQTAAYDDSSGLAGLCKLMRQQIDKFSAMQWPVDKASIAGLVTVFEEMPAHRWVLLDEAQRRVKGYAVPLGCMIGQFHPRCAEPAALNPEFPVSRSPEPLFAIRRMALHDILFLHASPPMFAEYQQRFGDRYNDPDHPVPETYARLYALAQQRGRGRGEYVDYQSIDVLLSLQQPRTDHPSEMVFYLSGQAKELLFKLMHEQARAVRMELASDHIDEAVWGLHRITATLDVLSRMWDVLGTLAPTEFNTFREQLGGASGIDSYMFRMVEFVLGRKSETLAARYASVPGIAEDVYRAFHDSSVYDEALSLLVRHELLDRDAADPARRNADVVSEAWADVYRTQGPSNALFRLAEALMDVAEGFGRWRALHLLTVERMIGSKSGTGGTDGVAWLRRSAEHRFFPELWTARTLLSSAPAPF